ncbi:MAG: glycosyltransferase [Verrucomicrobia bacterium]|nr:glycosyltransferase [Verrucomicrobiota bacterium]
MRILAVTNIYPSTSFPARGVFVAEQIKGLRAIGLDVRVLFVDRRQEGFRAYYRLGDKLGPAVAEFDPAVIHVMYGGVMADQIARHHHARPIVVTFHGSDLLGENLSGWTRKLVSRYGVHCSRRAARLADGVVVVARHLLAALHGAATPNKVRVVPCGIDLERFKPADGLAAKRRLGWHPDCFHVLFASSNGDPVKRPWLASAAVARLYHPDRPCALHYLAGIPNEQVPTWLNAGDALLLTSLHEGSPTVVKEALACGLPVVSVEVGDVAERLAGIDGCFLAQPDPADLADKLDVVRRRGRRLDCRPRLAELSLEHVAGRLNECYAEIANQSRAHVGAPRIERPAQAQTGALASPAFGSSAAGRRP